MPNKMVYVSDDDLALFQRAQDTSGASLSATVALALREYVERAEMADEGYPEQQVPWYKAGVRRYHRFFGAELARSRRRVGSQQQSQTLTVYRTVKGQFAVHELLEPRWGSKDPINETTSSFQAHSTVDELKAHVPGDLFDAVVEALDLPVVQDLDI